MLLDQDQPDGGMVKWQRQQQQQQRQANAALILRVALRSAGIRARRHIVVIPHQSCDSHHSDATPVMPLMITHVVPGVINNEVQHASKSFTSVGSGVESVDGKL